MYKSAYDYGLDTACARLGLSKVAYGVLKNIVGAAKEGIGYLTPEAKSTLQGMLGGAGVGAVTGAATDAPGGALGGALAGGALGGAGGRLRTLLAKRYSPEWAAARGFGSTAATRPATRDELLNVIKEQAKTGGLADTAARSIVGGGIGAGIGALAGDDPYTGFITGAGVGGLSGKLKPGWLKSVGERARGLPDKLRSLRTARAGAAEAGAAEAGAAAKAAPVAAPAPPPPLPGVQDFALRGPKDLVMQHKGELMNRMGEFMQNPEAWQAWAKQKGIDLSTVMG